VSGTVLIADGDGERGQRVAEACGERGITCSVTTHGAAALEAALADVPVALVAQFDLPLIDGPQLAAILRANPRTRAVGVIFVSDRSIEAERTDVGGAVIPPPTDPDKVAACVQAILDELDDVRSRATEDDADEGPGGVEGQLAQLPLADLLRIFHVSGKTGTVELSRRDGQGRPETGHVYLRGGDVIQAAVAPVEREKALYRLLAWDRGSFAFNPGPVTVEQGIQISTRALLRNGLRQLEEWERLAVDLPPLDALVTLKVQRSALPNVIYPLTQEVLLVLELESRVGDVVDRCSYPDYQVLRTLHTLIERGIVELRRQSESGPVTDEPGFFSPARAARLREWLDAVRPRGGPPADAKLLVIASDAAATRNFVQLLERLSGVELVERAGAGLVTADDLGPLGRLAVDGEIGIELLHVPAAERFAPLWPMAGHGALGTLLLLSSPVNESAESIRRVAMALHQLPRARLFHLLLIEKGERVEPDALRESPFLIDPGSLFLIPLENSKKASVLLQELFGRVVP
jgi:hypothetical protein